jgi:hypothetical protein
VLDCGFNTFESLFVLNVLAQDGRCNSYDGLLDLTVLAQNSVCNDLTVCRS